MKLFNLNICIKRDNNKGVVDLLKKDSYDIVTLQESMRKLDDKVNPFFDSCNFIRKNTKYENNFFGAVWVAKKQIKNGKILRDFGGYAEQGNQLLTNLPIIESRNVFFHKHYGNNDDRTNFITDDHPRAFIDVILKVGNKELQIINIHGTWTVDKQSNKITKIQTKALLEAIRDDIPSIVVGDLNLLPETKEIQTLSKKMHNLIEQYNINSTRPDFNDGLETGNIVCDYLFVNDKVKVNNFQILNSNVSDHFPMILDFDI